MKVGASVLAISVAAAIAVQGTPVTAAEPTDPGTTIVVDYVQSQGPASTELLGVNHRYNANGNGLWNARQDRPHEGAIAGSLRAGIQSLRFPGGTIANTYDWKRAIGPTRGCQIDGRGRAGFEAISGGLAFGPDEFMESAEEMNADPLIMVSFVRETPQGAADWVEYMNAPAGDASNPNGGVDWAERRAANGHPEPYGVVRWEIGNEQHHLDSRHWLSPDASTAAQQYAFGGTATLVDEPLGKGCNHPVSGVLSDGSPDQVFNVLYPPLDTSSVVVEVRGRLWRPVADLSRSRAKDRAYEVTAAGTVTFGDGVHGAIPPQGATVTATYDSVHEGYFSFVEEMKEVDPSIEVCASFGRVSFVEAVQGLDFDCLTTHPISALGTAGGEPASWVDELEGHDRIMLAAAQRRRGILKLLRALPDHIPLAFTEAAVVEGDHTAFPTWASSATQAAYMATKWGDWMELGIPWGMSSLLLGGNRAVLGERPAYTFSAEGLTREAILPMFTAGGDVLPASVEGNPVRTPEGMGRSYPGLAVTATRTPDGSVQLLVVNRLPTDAVDARIQVNGLVSQTAGVRTVRGDSFTDANRPDAPNEVTLEVSEVPVEAEGLVHTFPATSTTVIRLTPAPTTTPTPTPTPTP